MIIMQESLTAKFATPKMKAILLKTGNKTILEAPRYDKFWGSGIGLFDRQCLTINSIGENQMEKLLVYMREQIR